MLGRIRERSFSADFHEMEQDVPGAGRRTLSLHASGGVDEAQARRLLLLSIEDVSDRRAAERESEGCSSRWRHCCWQTSTRSPTACRSSRASSSSKRGRCSRRRPAATWRMFMPGAMRWRRRSNNSSARMMPAGSLRTLLSQLCETVGASMVAENRSGRDCLSADGGTVSATDAVSVGLIVTELVINALKHAFVDDRAAGRIVVTMICRGTPGVSAVSDNGIGRPTQAATPGLGTGIVRALVSQLDSRWRSRPIRTAPRSRSATAGIRTNARGRTSRLRRARQG